MMRYLDSMFELFGDWYEANDWMLIRIGAAALIGMLIGLEREFRDKPAGLRTMILISVGACVFAIVSEVRGAINADPTRIAAQVVTGVGFLGAGAILRDAKAVYGLTTAATIWTLAAIGLACGYGELDIAFAAGVGALLMLLVFNPLVYYIVSRRTTLRYRISTRDAAMRFKDFDLIFKDARLRVLKRTCFRDGDDFVYGYKVLGPRRRHTVLRERLMHEENMILLKR